MVSPWIAFGLAIAAALATYLGWGLTALRKQWPPRVFAGALVASGVAMIALSLLELVPTALDTGLTWLSLGLWAGLGGLLVVGLHTIAHRLEWGTNRLSRSALLIAVALAIHNIPEGAAPFGATLLSLQAGIVTAVAIALHNIPEGIAVSAPALAAGRTRLYAFALTTVSVVGEASGAVLALVFTEAFSDSKVAILLALVAGIMVTLSMIELLPSGYRLWRDAKKPAPEAILARMDGHD